MNAKLTNVKKGLKFEITEIKKNFETFKAKNHDKLAQFKATIKSVDRDYSRKLFWAVIPYAWDQVPNAVRVHEKLWTRWLSPDAQPW